MGMATDAKTPAFLIQGVRIGSMPPRVRRVRRAGASTGIRSLCGSQRDPVAGSVHYGAARAVVRDMRQRHRPLRITGKAAQRKQKKRGPKPPHECDAAPVVNAPSAAPPAAS